MHDSKFIELTKYSVYESKITIDVIDIYINIYICFLSLFRDIIRLTVVQCSSGYECRVYFQSEFYEMFSEYLYPIFGANL